MGGFECGDDAFGASEGAGGVERSGVGDGGIFGAALVGEPCVFGADGGIIETSGDGVRGGDLAVFGLQDVRVSTLQDAGARTGEALRRGEAGGVFAEIVAVAAGFDPYQLYVFVFQKFVEEADGV